MKKVFSDYQLARMELIGIAKKAKRYYPNDKPAVRQIINDSTHRLASEHNLSEHKTELLHNYACKLHPKDGY